MRVADVNSVSQQARELVGRVLERFPAPDETYYTLHFHNTRGLGLANVVAALEVGVTTFDSSLGGLGGCPFAPGATGNIVTEDLVFMLEAMGLKTGIDLPHEAEGLVPSSKWKLRTAREKWYAGETISVAIGQGQVSVTPLQTDLTRHAAIADVTRWLETRTGITASRYNFGSVNGYTEVGLRARPTTRLSSSDSSSIPRIAMMSRSSL